VRVNDRGHRLCRAASSCTRLAQFAARPNSQCRSPCSLRTNCDRDITFDSLMLKGREMPLFPVPGTTFLVSTPLRKSRTHCVVTFLFLRPPFKLLVLRSTACCSRGAGNASTSPAVTTGWLTAFSRSELLQCASTASVKRFPSLPPAWANDVC
jgi:hypothetical protein